MKKHKLATYWHGRNIQWLKNEDRCFKVLCVSDIMIIVGIPVQDNWDLGIKNGYIYWSEIEENFDNFEWSENNKDWSSFI